MSGEDLRGRTDHVCTWSSSAAPAAGKISTEKSETLLRRTSSTGLEGLFVGIAILPFADGHIQGWPFDGGPFKSAGP